MCKCQLCQDVDSDKVKHQLAGLVFLSSYFLVEHKPAVLFGLLIYKTTQLSCPFAKVTTVMYVTDMMKLDKFHDDIFLEMQTP